jgi:hypothetical protein
MATAPSCAASFLCSRERIWVPEPDVAVVPWCADGYASASGIYAGSNVPDCWVVNLRDGCVEWFREPEAEAGRYRESGVARGEELLPRATPGRALRAAELVSDNGAAK